MIGPQNNACAGLCVFAGAAVGCLLLAGCQSQIETTYGRRTGSAASSVNGTTVLGQMFADAGHQVSSWSTLSPALQEADVIVWAPDDFGLPSERVQSWLENWLAASYSPRVLIYVGRDFDAAPDYWTYMQSVAPPAQKGEVARRLAQARARRRLNRKDLPTEAEWYGWFSLEKTSGEQAVRQFSGPWSEDVDASAAEVRYHSRLVPITSAEVLLSADDGTVLVSEIQGPGTLSGTSDHRLILVQNGSFLLNLPLVNHEHRKLAGKLVDHVGPPRQRVVFLQSGADGPPIRVSDPASNPPSGLALFGIWPLNGPLVHLAALGIIYALARWPIFGLPRQLPRQSLTDFGAHVAALGKLLQRTGDHRYARQQLHNYRQTVARDSERKPGN